MGVEGFCCQTKGRPKMEPLGEEVAWSRSVVKQQGKEMKRKWRDIVGHCWALSCEVLSGWVWKGQATSCSFEVRMSPCSGLGLRDL